MPRSRTEVSALSECFAQSIVHTCMQSAGRRRMHSTSCVVGLPDQGYAEGLSWLRATRGQRAGANREGKGWQRAGPSWVWMIDCGEAHGNGPTAPNRPNWPGWPGWLKLGPIWTCRVDQRTPPLMDRGDHGHGLYTCPRRHLTLEPHPHYLSLPFSLSSHTPSH